jgi:hypothetical protein
MTHIRHSHDPFLALELSPSGHCLGSSESKSALENGPRRGPDFQNFAEFHRFFGGNGNGSRLGKNGGRRGEAQAVIWSNLEIWWQACGPLWLRNRPALGGFLGPEADQIPSTLTPFSDFETFQASKRDLIRFRAQKSPPGLEACVTK